MPSGTQLAAAVAIVFTLAAQPAPNRIVVFETEKGNIEIDVDAAHAPNSAANFLKYVDGRFYDGGTVNRAVRPDNTVRHDVEIQVIQFQIDPARRREQFPPVALERTNVTGLTHVDGAVSMARAGADTATASFSIVIGDQPEMDFGGKRNPILAFLVSPDPARPAHELAAAIRTFVLHRLRARRAERALERADVRVAVWTQFPAAALTAGAKVECHRQSEAGDWAVSRWPFRPMR